jgi:predicted acylesterase/phospholipase RssA
VAHQPIDQLAIRYAAVATDLHSGEPVLLAHGPVGAAVQASAAVPGVTAPLVLANGTQLIDGGLSSLVPVRAARALGAKAVIAVDIYCHSPRAEGPGALTIAGRALQGQNCRLAAPEMAEADVLIAPSVRVASLSDRDEQEAAVQAGYVAAKAALPRIRPGQRHRRHQRHDRQRRCEHAADARSNAGAQADEGSGDASPPSGHLPGHLVQPHQAVHLRHEMLQALGRHLVHERQAAVDQVLGIQRPGVVRQALA